jgi:hypothetical protein
MRLGRNQKKKISLALKGNLTSKFCQLSLRPQTMYEPLTCLKIFLLFLSAHFFHDYSLNGRPEKVLFIVGAGRRKKFGKKPGATS